MSNEVTRGNLQRMFLEDSETLAKLSKSSFEAKKPSITHESKPNRGIHFHFEFNKFKGTGVEDSFTIIVTPDEECLDSRKIKLGLVGLKPGVVLKEVNNDFDTFFKTFINMRDEYIEYKGEFKEENERSKGISASLVNKQNHEHKEMKDSLNKYL